MKKRILNFVKWVLKYQEPEIKYQEPGINNTYPTLERKYHIIRVVYIDNMYSGANEEFVKSILCDKISIELMNSGFVNITAENNFTGRSNQPEEIKYTATIDILPKQNIIN